MNYNLIHDCNSTGGCERCNPGINSAILRMPNRLTNPLFGRDTLNKWLEDKAKNAPTIERVREITAKLPSLSKFLSEGEDRND